MKLTVFGSNGRVGGSVVRLAEKRGHEVTKIDVGDNMAECNADVVIDFSVPQATEAVIDYCVACNCPLVTGVTGRNAKQQFEIDKLSERLPVVQSANFAEGIALFTDVCAKIAAAHPDWDVDVVEMHRRGKLDAPSGTAKTIAAKISQAKGAFGKVTIHSVRSGTNFGVHSVIFGGTGENITLTHRAENVEVFALGAIKQAEVLIAKRME